MLIKPFYNIQSSEVSNKNINPSQISFIHNNQPTSLLKKNQPNFYICRTTSQNHVCCGIIAQLNYHSSHSKVYKHEECFSEKLNNFCFTFQKLNIQFSPTLLVHDNHLKIEQYLNSIITSSLPNIIYNNEKTTYEIWVISPNEQIENLYNSITFLFIADGHHRISCLFSLNKNVCAYIIPKKCLKAYPIIRKYNHFNSCPVTFFEKTKHTFNAKTLTNEELNLWHGRYFALSHEKNNIVLSNGNHQKDFLKILTSFSSVNYVTEKETSFTNYKYDSNYQNINHNQDHLHLFIPELNIDNYFPYLHKKLLPVHSSWFEPKIPPGIIQMEIV